MRKILFSVVGLLLLLGLTLGVWLRLGDDEVAEEDGPQAVPVEVGEVRVGRIDDVQAFGGTLTSPAQVDIAAKVGGRVEEVLVDLSDTVQRGELVARLDDAEYQAAVAAAEAELAVAQANYSEAESAAEIATRELGRVRTLQERGVSSEAQYDTARSAELTARSRIEVARAEMLRAEATLQQARIRLAYATVTANWTGGDNERVVAARYVEEGDTVAANAPLLSIVELDPIRAELFVTERDYARLQPGQPVTLTTDAYPGRSFTGTVDRVAPTFDEGSRQARVELEIPNEERLLRPGLFVRVTATLDTAEDAVVVPEAALSRREGGFAVFVLRGETAELVPVEVGIRRGGEVQLLGTENIGAGDRVVTLGQQLLDDGSTVTIPDDAPAAVATSEDA